MAWLEHSLILAAGARRRISRPQHRQKGCTMTAVCRSCFVVGLVALWPAVFLR